MGGISPDIVPGSRGKDAQMGNHQNSYQEVRHGASISHSVHP